MIWPPPKTRAASVFLGGSPRTGHIDGTCACSPPIRDLPVIQSSEANAQRNLKFGSVGGILSIRFNTHDFAIHDLVPCDCHAQGDVEWPGKGNSTKVRNGIVKTVLGNDQAIDVSFASWQGYVHVTRISYDQARGIVSWWLLHTIASTLAASRQ